MYRIILDEKSVGVRSGTAYITEEGAKIIWAAEMYRFQQTMERREERGGICWLSEIKWWIKKELLPKDFNWKTYQMTKGE